MASALASAAAGAANPFGLPGGAANGQAPQGFQLLNPARKPVPDPSQSQSSSPVQTPVMPIPITAATTPGAAAAPTPSAGQFPFNLQTDIALQQVNALAGLSDQQAQAQALKQRQQELIQYGDPHLAAAVLGQGDPMALAAGQNQESQLAMLGRERDQNLHNFETQLDPSLTFSGYRVGQEQKLGQAYQDALAQAASGVNQGLDSITGNLNSALQQNQMQRANGLGTAEANRLALILSGLGGGTGAGAAPPGQGSALPGSIPGDSTTYSTPNATNTGPAVDANGNTLTGIGNAAQALGIPWTSPVAAAPPVYPNPRLRGAKTPQ